MNSIIIVEEKEAFRTEKYKKLLGIDEVVIVNDLAKAKELLKPDKNGEPPYSMLIISTVFIEKNLKENELKEISEFFVGAIISRVDSEQAGVDLLKLGVVTDYYVSDKNEAENLKNAIKNAEIYRRCISRLVDMRQKLGALNIIQQVAYHTKPLTV